MNARNPKLSPMICAALLLLVTGCATKLDGSPPPVVVLGPQVPPLPPAARPPTPPAICSQTCSSGWTRMAENWLNTPTEFGSQGKPASPATKP